ncbi:MAG: hypothetical protein HOV81_29960 [Kofleriaceae bacterium]|nr:hypothetical protein [Kofleriaceae bacterium]
MGKRLSLAALACLIACGPPSRKGGVGDDDGSNGGVDSSVTDDGCADGTELIYTIDQFNYRLSQFDPATKTFHDLGSLSCPGGGTPFSMSVDRSGNAWVLYTTGELFKVAINSGLTCTKLPWTSPNGLEVFGMGFSTDMPGGSTESLYIGGGQTQTQTSFTLARVDPTTMATTVLGTQSALPEMTGTGNAELWGFMPEPTTARVVQFDKSTGAILTTHVESQLGGTMTAYAFAHWGGHFWVFLQKGAETSTTVYEVDGMTGVISTATPATGRTIVGAGVSTCAPVVIL